MWLFLKKKKTKKQKKNKKTKKKQKQNPNPNIHNKTKCRRHGIAKTILFVCVPCHMACWVLVP